jgi:imidazolonepropionase-like amidohydrolase
MTLTERYLNAVAAQLPRDQRADIIAVDGDPLTDVSVLTSMDFVMRDGRVYRDED